MNETTQVQDDVIYRFWQQAIATRNGSSSPQPQQDIWFKQIQYLSEVGIGVEEAVQYLYREGPAYDQFREWIASQGTAMGQENTEEQVLNDAELTQWEQDGYIVLKNAVPVEQCEAARDAIWSFLGASEDNPQSWYHENEGTNGMMLNFFRHPALDANRRSARIRRAYQQLYGETETYLYVDKVSFNPPETDHHTFRGSPLHWDTSLVLPIPFALQGLLYLTDTEAKDGAFHCVPGFHREVGAWLASLPPGTDPRNAALQQLQPIPIPGKAGDLVIWHQALPHCATPNKGRTPRMVQYINYLPVQGYLANEWK